ncbi:MAG: hypothetical protein ACREXS_18750 [Gammaproteobacteria bacterium]
MSQTGLICLAVAGFSGDDGKKGAIVPRPGTTSPRCSFSLAGSVLANGATDAGTAPADTERVSALGGGEAEPALPRQGGDGQHGWC